MSALAISTVDPPEMLPVAYLSASSLDLYARCPMAWKRRYIDKEQDRPNGKMVLGSAAGAALAQHYALIIETGEGLCTEAVLDEFSGAYDGRSEREDVEWGNDVAGTLKDAGAGALRIYHQRIAPTVVPVAVERGFELTWDGAPFTLTGFIDLETADDQVGDFKLSDKRWSRDKARAQLQPTVYLAARRAEANPAAGFQYHTMIRTNKPSAEIVPTERSERQLNLLTNRVFSVARSMEWRWLNDCWAGTPPDLAWLCRGCGFNQDCPWSLA